MRVLLTGGSGFVGLALCEALLARGDTVVALDRNPPPAAAARHFATLPGTLRPVQGDVRDGEAIGALLREHAPDRFVIGAAVTADAARERADPAGIVSVNVAAVATALHAAARTPPGRVLLLSSGAVYGDTNAPLLREDAVPNPGNLYAITKLAGEAVAVRLAALHGLPLVVARLGTVFGPWEHATGQRDTLSPPWQLLQLARAGTEAVLPRPARRDWLYSRDVARALLALLDAPALVHERYNVGSGTAWPLTQWCEALARRFPAFRWRVEAQAAPNVELYAPRDRAPLDTARLRETGFAGGLSPEAALGDYLEWLDATGAGL